MSRRGSYRSGSNGRVHMHGLNRAVWKGVKAANRQANPKGTPEPSTARPQRSTTDWPTVWIVIGFLFIVGAVITLSWGALLLVAAIGGYIALINRSPRQ